jgi:hypothetical protein
MPDFCRHVALGCVALVVAHLCPKQHREPPADVHVHVPHQDATAPLFWGHAAVEVVSTAADPAAFQRNAFANLEFRL